MLHMHLNFENASVFMFCWIDVGVLMENDL